MKKFFLTVSLLMALAAIAVSAEDGKKKRCPCGDKCKCTVESHCGCYSDKGCHCEGDNSCCCEE